MFFKTALLVALVAFLSACSDMRRKYRDTSYLEEPPRLKIIETETTVAEDATSDEIEQNPDVYLDDNESPPVLMVKKLFDRSWELVDQLLTEKSIKIKDKNREKGVYYVSYKPKEDDGYVIGGVKFLFFEDSYEESDYIISLKWKDTATQIRVKFQSEQDFSFDEEETTVADASEQLVNVLYKGIEEQLAE